MRLALICGLVCSTFVVAHAQGEIEMDEDHSTEKPATDKDKDKPAEPATTDQPATDAPPADQPVVKDPKVAKKWLQAGDQLVRAGDKLVKQNKADEAKTEYTNAVTAYTKAIEASDDVSLNWQLAVAEDKAGDTPSAMKHLKLITTGQNLKADVVKKATAKLDELSMKVGVLTLTVTPDGTQVSIEGKQVGEAPMTDPLVLMPGSVTISFTAVGYQPKEVEFKIEAGAESERKIALDPVPIVNHPVVDEPEPEPEKPKAKNPMIPVYIGAGATGALLLTATITGIIAVGDHSTYVDPKATKAERADAQSSGRTMAHITDICLVGMIGAAAFTSYWYLYKVRPEQHAMAERQASKGSKVEVVPWVQPTAGGLIAVGSF